jgi:hypothetical protein
MGKSIVSFFEIAQMYRKGEIGHNDPRLKQAEELLAEMASTEDGRQEIADVIGIYIDQMWNKFDIAPRIFTYRNFNLGDKAEFRLKKKGVTAYWIAPNSFTPKSRNYQETLPMEFDTVSVRPEALIDELKAGRIQGFADLMSDAQEAMSDAIVGKVFTILGQVYNATTTPEMYHQDTTELTQAGLNGAIDTVFYRTGVRPTIIGDQLLVNQIMGFAGYSQELLTEIQRTGSLGVYRGAEVMGLPMVLDPVSGKNLVPTNRLYIVSSKVGYAGTYGDAKSGQETDIDDWTWNARIDKEWGATVTDPRGMFVLEVV